MNINRYAWALFIALLAITKANAQIWLSEEITGIYELGNRRKGHDKEELIQLKVADQSRIKGSEEDCGYHALFNGLAIGKLIHSASVESQQQWLKWLGNFNEKKEALFGSTQTPWKQIVQIKRTQKKALTAIIYHLTKAFHNSQELAKKPDDGSNLHRTYTCHLWDSRWITKENRYIECIGSDEKELNRIDKIVSIIRDAAVELIKPCVVRESSLLLALSSEQIIKTLEDLLIKKLGSVNDDPMAEEAYTEISKAGISNFLSIEDITLTIPFDKTNWLYDDEISLLLNDASTSNYFNDETEPPVALEKISFFILGNSPKASKSMKSDRNVKSPAFDKLKEAMSLEKNHLAIILLYEPLEDHAKEGHWFTLVINRIDNKNQFILADSLKNQERFDNQRVLEVIALLTGKKMPLPKIIRSPQKPAPDRNGSSLSNLFKIKTVVCTALIIAIVYYWWNEYKGEKKKKSNN